MFFFCFRCKVYGTCLVSFSVAMSGNSRYTDDLSMILFTELYLNSEFYAKHPSFVKVMNSHSGDSGTLLGFSFSSEALDSSKTKIVLVKEEALNICFLCINDQALCVGPCFILRLFEFCSILLVV